MIDINFYLNSILFEKGGLNSLFFFFIYFTVLPVCTKKKGKEKPICKIVFMGFTVICVGTCIIFKVVLLNFVYQQCSTWAILKLVKEKNYF